MVFLRLPFMIEILPHIFQEQKNSNSEKFPPQHVAIQGFWSKDPLSICNFLKINSKFVHVSTPANK